MLDIFSQNDWQRIRDEYEGWWTRKREKPVLHLFFYDVDPGMKRPEGLITENLYEYPEDEPAERIAEKYEYILRSRKYEFQAYPHMWIYFGPIYSVEFIGCRPHIAPTTVWFAPEKKVPPSELTIAPDPGSVFLPREIAIRKAVEERFGGGYVISSPLGGGYALDAVAEFYGHNDLTYMLYDEPDEVKRLMQEASDALDVVGNQLLPLTPNATGYTSWGGIYAPIPWICTQCDYSAMIGPHHFNEFALPDLTEAIARSPLYNYYHLDGPGEIVHMDTILSIPHLKCMQWVAAPHGDPKLDIEVYNRIHKAGVNQWVTGSLEKVRDVAWKNGTTQGIYWYGAYSIKDYDRVMKMADDLMNGR